DAARNGDGGRERGVCRNRGPDELRNQHFGCVAPVRLLRRPHPEGGEASRFTCFTIDQVRAGHQRSDCKNPPAYRSGQAAGRRRRGDRMSAKMKRREFITLLGGVAAAWPLAARAQQSDRMRRIGMLIPLNADDKVAQDRIAVFVQGLKELGWIEGRNVQFDIRFGAGVATTLKQATEMVALAPEVILANGSAAMGPLLQVTSIVPIVFVIVPDPVGAGYVASLARPGGNATGFTSYEYGMTAKWPELLKQIAPSVKRVAVIRDPAISAGLGQFAAIQSVAPSLGVEVIPINVRDPSEIERDIAAFARLPNGGLIVTGSALAAVHSGLIVTLAPRHKLPAIYSARFFVTDGGLIAYGTEQLDEFRRAASYVDRILKGEKPADLPVQASTKYELVINLKTAKALGLEIPQTLLATADEVIE